MRFVHHREALLNLAKKVAHELHISIETEVVVAHRTSDGILAAAERHKATALVIGWKGFTNARDRIFGEIADQVIRYAPCDLMVLKIEGDGPLKRCFLPTAGGPNARLAADLLNTMAGENGMEVTAGYVITEDHREFSEGEIEDRLNQTLSSVNKAAKTSRKVILANSVAGGIAKASRDFDLVVIGAAKEPFFRKMLFGEIPEKVARFSPTSVLVVKKYEGVVKSVLKKVIG